MVFCLNCNTTADYKKYSKEQGEETIIQLHTCMCGRLKKQTFYQKVTQAYWFDEKNIKRD